MIRAEKLTRETNKASCCPIIDAKGTGAVSAFVRYCHEPPQFEQGPSWPLRYSRGIQMRPLVPILNLVIDIISMCIFSGPLGDHRCAWEDGCGDHGSLGSCC